MTNDSYIELKRTALKQYFSRMNEMQQKAVFTVNGPLLVLAGAGSGKTTVIVNRIANMINFGNAFYDEKRIGNNFDIDFLKNYISGNTDDLDGLRDAVAVNPIRPWNILAITFTNKAAGELKERLNAMLGEDALNVNAATFHSACVRILRQEIDHIGFANDFTIYDSDDSQRLIKSIVNDMEIAEKQFPPKGVLSEISSAKNKMITPEMMHENAGSDYRKKTISRIYANYCSRLKDSNAVDFDDILLHTVEIFEKFPEVLEKFRNKYRYIMVDEYQDTNMVQFKLVSLLSEQHKNICVVGDDDQSIYKFRGADITNILSFEKQFDKCCVIRLEQNYRSTQTILDAANSVIKNNENRKPKSLWTNGDSGNKVCWYKAYDENDEAQFVADRILESYKESGKYSNNAVLYRMNAESNIIERSFVKSGIPYKVYGGMRFYDRKEIKDVTAYLSFINNPNDMLRFKRIVNEPKRSIGDATVTVLEEICRDLKLSPLEVMRNCADYPPLAKKTAPLKALAAVFDDLIKKSSEMPLDKLLDEVLNKTGYMASLKALGDEGVSRIENVNELNSTIVSYVKEAQNPSLNEFLEEISLYTEADRDDGNDDKVTLMTIHAAKGLEYDNIFIVGMEEGIFPSIRSMDNPEDLEEERRLAYVALTRAKKKLFLSNASQRMLFGQTQRNITSRFIKEIDSSLIEKHDHASSVKSEVHEDANAVTAIYSSSLQQQLARNKNKPPVPSAAIEFSAGEKVIHNIFGEGTVISVKKMANDSMLEIAFEKVGTKRLMANFAKIKKL